MDERPDNSEQLMNILLVMDQEKRSSYLPRVTRKRRGNVTAEYPEFGKNPDSREGWQKYGFVQGISPHHWDTPMQGMP